MVEYFKLLAFQEVEVIFTNENKMVEGKAELTLSGLEDAEFFNFMNAATTIPNENTTFPAAKKPKMGKPDALQPGGKVCSIKNCIGMAIKLKVLKSKEEAKAKKEGRNHK